MPLGIDWSKVDERNNARLAALKPKDEPKPTMTRATGTRQRAASAKTAPTAKVDTTAKTETTHADDDGVDTEVENADGEKV